MMTTNEGRDMSGDNHNQADPRTCELCGQPEDDHRAAHLFVEARGEVSL